jgi:anti-sigma B factor antagonist/serine/threonine-protein kinase RsbW
MDMTSKMQVPAELQNLGVIRRFVQETATALGSDRKAVDDMVQAVEEVAANIVVHGYHGQPGDIEVEVSLEKAMLVVRLRDRAILFDPTSVPPPDLTLPLEERRLGGLGIHLTRYFTDSMTYRVTDDGRNELTLRRKIGS